MDQPLPEEEKIFIDGSARCIQRKRCSGYAVVDGINMVVIIKEKLPSPWSVQCCELHALKKGLKYLAQKKGTICTDSRYAYGVVHTFGKIWEERGLLNSKGKGLVHERLILEVLEALHYPEEVAVLHGRGHQKGMTLETRGNNMADKEAWDAAEHGDKRVRILKTEEGGVCGKFSTSDCCLKIDDAGEAVLEITQNIRKIAHVPVQRWESMFKTSWWDNAPGTEWWKKLGFFLLCAVGGLLFLPCLIPCFIRLITSVVQGMLITTDPKTLKKIKARRTGKVMMVKRNTTPRDISEEAKLIYERHERISKIKRECESQMV